MIDVSREWYGRNVRAKGGANKDREIKTCAFDKMLKNQTWFFECDTEPTEKQTAIERFRSHLMDSLSSLRKSGLYEFVTDSQRGLNGVKGILVTCTKSPCGEWHPTEEN